MVSVVYPIKSPSEELKYSLRSLEKNASILIDNVWIVGEMPTWASNLNHLPAGNPFSRIEDFRAKVTAAANHPHVSEQFLLMHDDFFLIKPIEKFQAYHMGSLHDYIDEMFQDPTISRRYVKVVETTYNWMKSQGFSDQLTWQGHRPLLWDKARLADSLKKYPKGLALDVVGLYEMAGSEHRDYATRGVNSKVYETEVSLKEKLQQLDHPWLSTSDSAFSGRAGAFIRQMFPEPSDYEIVVQ